MMLEFNDVYLCQITSTSNNFRHINLNKAISYSMYGSRKIISCCIDSFHSCKQTCGFLWFSEEKNEIYGTNAHWILLCECVTLTKYALNSNIELMCESMLSVENKWWKREKMGIELLWNGGLSMWLGTSWASHRHFLLLFCT